MGTKRRRAQDDENGAANASATATPATKKQQLYTKDDADLANLYSRLADDVKATRLQAAKEILKIVDAADKPKIEKIGQRLIRGLCSNRKAARLGYVIVLTELFAKQCPAADDAESWMQSTIASIESITTPPANGSNQERRDYHLGRCLAFRSLVQSKVFTAVPGAAGVGCFQTLLRHAFALFKEAPALRQECGATVNSILPSVNGAKNAQDLTACLLQSYQQHGLAKTAEGLAAWLFARSQYPDMKFPEAVWHNNDPLHPKERASILQILRDNNADAAALDGTTAKSTSGTAQRVPCSAWPIVLKELYSRSAKEDKSAFFAKFWTEVVNDGFFSDKASVERKAIGLQVVQMAGDSAPVSLIQHVFSPNVIRCIINQRSESGKTNLFTAAQAPLQALVKRARREQSAVLPVIVALIQTAGLPNFDRLTKTKTLEDVLACATADDAEAILDIIFENIRHPKTSAHLDSDNSRRNSADLLLAMARKQSAAKPDEESFPWKSLLKVLARSAYLVHKKDKQDALPKKIREIFQARTTSVLTVTMDSKADAELDHAWQVVDIIEHGVQSEKYSLALSADDTILQILSTALLRVKEIKAQEAKAPKDRKLMLQAFKLLFSLSILQVHNGDPDAVSILEELEDCYEAWSESKNSSSALVDILLGFVARPSAIFRKMAEQVFSAIAPQLDGEGLEPLLNILEKSENLSGQKELFDQDEDVDEEAAAAMENESDDEDDHDHDDDSDSSDDSDVEVIDVEEDSASDSEESDGSGEENSDAESETSESSADEADDEMLAFEAKLAQTLGTSLAQEGDSSDDSDMDDDQMMALDNHLTTIFKERSKQTDKKKEHKDARGTVVNFKNRVLDLLAIYVKQCSSNALSLDLILPLVTLVRTTNTKPISERSFAILKQLFDTCSKHKSYPSKPTEALLEELEHVHDELRKSPSKLHASAASRSALFLARVIVSQDKESYDDIVDLYAALQKEWYANPKSKIPASCFTEWTSWSLNSRNARE